VLVLGYDRAATGVVTIAVAAIYQPAWDRPRHRGCDSEELAVTRFQLPRRTWVDLTPEEQAADDAAHDEAMERLITAVAGAAESLQPDSESAR
jgi:hypothetical protein